MPSTHHICGCEEVPEHHLRHYLVQQVSGFKGRNEGGGLCTYLQSGLPYGCWGTNHLDFKLENLWIMGSKSTSLTCIFPHSSPKEALLGYCTWTSTSSIRYFDCQGPSVPGLLIREPGQFPKKATNSAYWEPAVHIPPHPRILTA